MKCPFCSARDTQVLESRIVEDENSIRRRRVCDKCKKRFTTYEKPKSSVLWVIKKDGKREPFDKEKLKRGILRAIEKRPVAIADVNKAIDAIEREMLGRETEEVNSEAIGDAVIKHLKRLDKVAWLRFVSVYLEFEDLSDFEKAIKK